MPRARQNIFYDKRQNMWVGKFWKLKEPGRRPLTRDILDSHEHVSPDEIDQAFRRIEGELIKETFGHQDAEPTMFEDAAQLWLKSIEGALSPRTITEYRRAIKLWVEINGNHSLTYFNSDANARFLQNRLGQNASDATIQKDQRSLQVFANWLFHEGTLDRQIYIRKRRVESKEPEIYTEDDLDRMEKLIKKNGRDDWLRTYWMARYAVMRVGEIWALPLNNIDLHRRTITVGDVPELGWTVKTRQRRKVAIGKNLLSLLQQDLKTRSPNERGFLDTGHGDPAYTTPWSLTQVFRRRCKKLGIIGPKPLHGIRSAGITKMLLTSGGRAELVAAMAGHSVAVMLKHYARITDQDAKKVADLL